MRLLRRITLALFAGLLLTLGLVVPAHAAPKLTLRNSPYSVASLKVCRDWGSTSCSSGICYLNAGENSRDKCNWQDDADGFYVPGDQYATGDGGVTRWNGPKWVKRGDCYCTFTARLYWK